MDSTLAALRKTSKGMINYRTHMTPFDETSYSQSQKTDSASLKVEDGLRRLTLRDVQSILDGSCSLAVDYRSRSPPLTVNTILQDSESEEDETESPPTSSESRIKYYLDTDNSPSVTPKSKLSSKGSKETVTESTRAVVSTSKSETVVHKPIDRPSSADKFDHSVDGRRGPDAYRESALSCMSPEHVALRNLKDKQNRETQERIIEKQSAVKDELESIEKRFESMMDDLKLSRQLDELRREEFWERHITDSERAHEKELERIRRRSQMRDDVINEAINKVKQEQQEIEEQRLKQAENVRLQKDAEDERRRKERAALANQCSGLIKGISQLHNNIKQLLDSPLITQEPELESFMGKNRVLADQIWEKVLSYRENITPTTPAKLQSLLEYLVKLQETVSYQLDSIDKRFKAKQQQEQQLRAQQEQKLHSEQEQQLRAQQVFQQQPSQQQEPVTHSHAVEPVDTSYSQPSSQPSQSVSGKQLLDLTTYQDCFEEFLRLDAVVKNASEASKLMSNNPQTKRMKMSLQKAVSITINSISAQSGSALKKKVGLLQDLLSGRSVSVGNDSVSTNGIPEAVMFCKNLTAKKLVDQADSQVSANPKTAFPFAAVMVTLMNNDKEMKDLVLGYFYIQCPYLLPYYPAKQPEQSTEEYFGSLGYKVTNGVVEKQDQFTKRMAGLCKLYGSCLISSAVGGADNTSLNIDNAWSWLARTVNLQPRPAITATMLESMILVCGARLLAVYGRQAAKLLNVLQTGFMPQIRSVTDQDTDGGAAEKLDQMLIELQKNHPREPQGLLSRGFWYS